MELETEIEVFKHKQSVAFAKKQAEAEALGNSFTEFQNPKSRGQSMTNQKRPGDVTGDEVLGQVTVGEEPTTPGVIDERGGNMEIEAPLNDLGEFESG